MTTDERGRASQHGRKTGRENPRFQAPSDPDTKPHSAHGDSGGLTRNVGSTASVGNTSHMKHLERAWNAGLTHEGGAGGGAAGSTDASAPSVYKSGYSVDLMSTRELMELRRGIEATLDVRGVAPVSTCVRIREHGPMRMTRHSCQSTDPRGCCMRSVTYDWHTDAGEAGTVTARVGQERPRSAGPARDRPEWMGACARVNWKLLLRALAAASNSVFPDTPCVGVARSRSAATADGARGKDWPSAVIAFWPAACRSASTGARVQPRRTAEYRGARCEIASPADEDGRAAASAPGGCFPSP